MTVRKYSSRAQQTTLSSAITDTATSMTVVSGSALMGGKTLTGSQTYTVVIDPDTSLEEIVDVTLYSSGNTLTITRNRDGSSAVAHSAGAVVRHMIIGRDLQEANDHIEASSAVHGLTGTVVGTTDTQTLTNKTLTAPTVSGATISGTVTSTATITGGTVNATTLQQGGVQAVTTTDTQTLSNKTLTTPTIASFTNATHDHTNAAGGGTLTTSAISGIQEYVEDTVGAMVSSNTESGIAVTYDDSTGKLNFDISDPVITLDGDITGSATMTNLGNTTITTAISSGSIVNADVSASAAIAYSKLNLAGSITSSDITDGTIVNGDISASAGIAYSKLSLNSSITSSDIVDGTIVNADISGTANIALSKLATDPLARANHTGTQTASTISDFDTQVRTSRLDQMAAPTGSVSLNSQKITSLGTPTASGDAATKGYIDTEITNLINGAPGTLDTLKEIADQIQAGGTFYDSVVFKSGSTMTGALTLYADPSSNLHAATKQYVDAVAGSATAAASSATAAAASYDSFDDRYLGAKSSAPTLDNDGNALLTGALYWNSVDNAMYAWSGTAWGSISSTAAIYRYKFVATGGETSVSGTDANNLTLSYLAGKEQVYLNGVLLVRDSDYTASNGTSITGLAALTASDVLEVITFTAFDLATAIPNTTIDAKGDLLVGTAADTVGKLSAGTNEYRLVVDSATATGLKYVADTTNYAIAAKGDLLVGTAADTVQALTAGSNGDSLVADSSATTGLRWQGNYGAGKNRIINGSMLIDQRNAGSSLTITNTAANTYTLDRWFAFGNNASKFSVQQNAGSVTPPAGFSKYLGVTSLAATTVSAGDQYIVGHAIEGQNIIDFAFGGASAKTITLSFWVRSSLTGTFGGALRNSAANRAYPFTYTISSANTWEQKSVTVAGDTTGTWLTDTGVGLYIYFGLGVGSTYLGTAGSWAAATYTSATGGTNVVSTNGATWYITGVQLEIGSVATAFQTATGTIAGELAACQRYYFVKAAAGANPASFGMAAYVSSNDLRGSFSFPVEMRTTPTLVATTGTNYYRTEYLNDGFNSLTIYWTSKTETGWYNSGDTASGTAGTGSIVSTNNTLSSIALSAEL